MNSSIDFNKINDETRQEIKNILKERMEIPEWVENTDSTVIYAYALQCMKQLHKKQIESTKLNIVMIQRLCDISKNIMSLLSAKNYAYIVAIIKSINELATDAMSKHYDTHLSLPKDIMEFTKNKPSDKLIKRMFEELDLPMLSSGQIAEEKDPYYKSPPF